MFVVGTKTNSVLSVSAITESSFLKVNTWNNNNYDSSAKTYLTMLEFSDNFAATDKSITNIATASQDLGNKMTLNGVAVKDIPNFFASYYYATDVSKPMIKFVVPEAYMEPSGGYSHTTLFMPKGTAIYDRVTGNNVEIFISNNKRIETDPLLQKQEWLQCFTFPMAAKTSKLNITQQFLSYMKPPQNKRHQKILL